MRISPAFSILFIIAILLTARLSLAQQTGIFEKEVTIDGQQMLFACFVPEDYDDTRTYPLVVGMSGGGGPGFGIRGMILPVAALNDIILICPDGNIGSRALPHVLEFGLGDYNIDSKNVVLTGYSAGGASVFNWGMVNPGKVKGVIGIAASVGWVDVNYINNRAFGMICGDDDSAYWGARTITNMINDNGGACLFIPKEGVGHFDPYFGSEEFLDDWKKCYDFIQDFQPRPQVKLVSPANGEYAPEKPVTLVWNSMEEATEYEVRVFDIQNTHFLETVSDTSFVLNGLQDNKNYFWRVRHIGDSAGEWSHMWSFTTEAFPPEGIAELVFPADGAEGIHTFAALRWKHVTGANFYHIQVSSDDFETLFINDSTFPNAGATEALYTARTPFITATRYKWKVRGGTPGGYGPWSDVHSFTTYDPNTVDDINTDKHLISSVYPIPAQDRLNLNIELETTTQILIKIHNINGVLCYTGDDSVYSPGSHKIELKLNDLGCGVYLYELNAGRSGTFSGCFTVIK